MGIGVVLAEPTGATALFVSAMGEEILKATAALGVVAVIQQHRPRNLVRLAALVGLGFASAEAVLYIWQFGADVLWVRMLWTAPAHMAYTVICVCGLLAWQRGARTAVVVAVGWSFLAHAGTNLFMLQEAPGAALGALGLFAFSLAWAHLLLQQASPVVFGRKVGFAMAPER
jgi:RsiW-degrading membrane proteinase PrsW (M82 family)